MNLAKKMMKMVTIFTILSFSILLISCSNDDEIDPGFDFTGKYIIASATGVENPIVIDESTFVPIDDETLKELVENVLLSTSPCLNPFNAVMDLRADKEIYFACFGEPITEQTGSWSSPSSTELILDFVFENPVPPPPDLELQVKLKNIQVSNGKVTGQCDDFPLPLSTIDPDLPDVWPTQVTLTLEEVSNLLE